MNVIAREITEDEWRMIEAQRAAQVIVGGEPGSTYPWVKLAQEVVRLRSQHAGAVAALERIAEGAENVVVAGETVMDAQWVAGVARNALNLLGGQ